MDYESVIFVGYSNDEFLRLVSNLYGRPVTNKWEVLEEIQKDFGVHMGPTYNYDEPWEGADEEQAPVGITVASCYRGAKELDMVALGASTNRARDKLLDIFGKEPKVFWGPDVS